MRKQINRTMALKFDSYKASHYCQFPPDTEEMFYYVEPRIEDTDVMIFGQQELILKHFIFFVNSKLFILASCI